MDVCIPVTPTWRLRVDETQYDTQVKAVTKLEVPLKTCTVDTRRERLYRQHMERIRQQERIWLIGEAKGEYFIR